MAAGTRFGRRRLHRNNKYLPELSKKSRIRKERTRGKITLSFSFTSLSAMLIPSSLVSNHISVAMPTRTRSCSFVADVLLVACAIRSPEGVKRMAVCILDGVRTAKGQSYNKATLRNNKDGYDVLEERPFLRDMRFNISFTKMCC